MVFIKRILGVLLLVYGSVLALWIGYNLLVEMTERFPRRKVNAACAMAFGSLFVGWRWVRGRAALDDTDGKPHEVPPEVAPEIAAAYPGVQCRCGFGRFLKLRTGGLWCDLCKVWVVPPRDASEAKPGAAPDAAREAGP